MEQEQKIKIVIADKDFMIAVRSPEQEEMMRDAAKYLNKGISFLMTKFPGKTMTDILSLVALNVATDRIRQTKISAEMEKEIEALHRDTSAYLSDIEKSSR